MAAVLSTFANSLMHFNDPDTRTSTPQRRTRRRECPGHNVRRKRSRHAGARTVEDDDEDEDEELYVPEIKRCLEMPDTEIRSLMCYSPLSTVEDDPLGLAYTPSLDFSRGFLDALPNARPVPVGPRAVLLVCLDRDLPSSRLEALRSCLPSSSAVVVVGVSQGIPYTFVDSGSCEPAVFAKSVVSCRTNASQRSAGAFTACLQLAMTAMHMMHDPAVLICVGDSVQDQLDSPTTRCFLGDALSHAKHYTSSPITLTGGFAPHIAQGLLRGIEGFSTPLTVLAGVDEGIETILHHMGAANVQGNLRAALGMYGEMNIVDMWRNMDNCALGPAMLHIVFAYASPWDETDRVAAIENAFTLDVVRNIGPLTPYLPISIDRHTKDFTVGEELGPVKWRCGDNWVRV